MIIKTAYKKLDTVLADLRNGFHLSVTQMYLRAKVHD